MKKNILFLSVIATLISSGAAFADEAKPDNEVSFNASLASDYRYRGISQTRLEPALQGGAAIPTIQQAFTQAHGYQRSNGSLIHQVQAVHRQSGISTLVSAEKSRKMFRMM